MDNQLTPDMARVALLGVLTGLVQCTRAGDDLQLDTPYVLQDGHLLRAFVCPGETPGSVLVTDGGFAQRQAEIFARSSATLQARMGDFQRIALQLGITWDAEFSYSAADIDEAVRRLPDLVRAVDRALGVLNVRPGRAEAPLAKRLRDDLRAAGLRVEPRARIEVRPGQSVLVDYRTLGSSREAAVELLGGRTKQGAEQSVDHAVTNFHVLAGSAYQGLLIAVYEEDSPAGTRDLRDRFMAAKPQSTVLVGGHEAAGLIAQRLAA